MTIHAVIQSAPPGRHFAQLHSDPGELTGTVAEFAAAGLKRGERVILIVVPSHLDLILDSLAGSGWRADAFISSGQLTILDAESLLERFMRGGAPQWNPFRALLGAVLGEHASVPTSGIRAYGEMVNLLWQRGETAAAIQLEEFWNDLAREFSFSLMCGYLLDGLHEHGYAGPLQDIGRTHTDILATPRDERLHAAVEAATREVLGRNVSLTLSLSGREEVTGEHRLPPARRSVLWIKRNMPSLYTRVLERARHHFESHELRTRQ